MSERGSHAAVPPLLSRYGKLLGGIALIALLAVLLVFGDEIFGDAGGSPEPGTDEPTLSTEKQEDLQPEVTETASRVLDTWARNDRPYKAWWKALEPMLTPGAREAYAFTNPAKVPVLGEPEPTGKPDFLANGRHATVFFDTEAGTFGVDLSRRSRGWLANRVIFPGGESMFR